MIVEPKTGHSMVGAPHGSSMRISVIGGGTITDEQRERADAVGRELGARGHTVVCGGRGGTMEAVCRGAKAAGGTTIGILPAADPEAPTTTSISRLRPGWATPETRSFR